MQPNYTICQRNNNICFPANCSVSAKFHRKRQTCGYWPGDNEWKNERDQTAVNLEEDESWQWSWTYGNCFGRVEGSKQDKI